MAAVSVCPQRPHIEKLATGQLPFAEADKLAEHLEHCPSCIQTVQSLKCDDTLAELIRKQPPSISKAEEAALQKLVEKLRALQPALGKAQEPETSRELYDFLSPAQGPGELGRLGQYRVLKVLGHGGMGVVYQAEDAQLKRQVAIKAMLPRLATSETARKRFIREAQAAAGIKHDHIVTIYQVGEDRGIPFLAMEFLEGMSLDDYLKKGRKVTLGQILRVGREVALGLAAAHERGLIHRDIKPANIWLESPKGRSKILDFGLARTVGDDANLTQSGVIVGTPAYMAPEQAKGVMVDFRCDLFSLGCVLYRLCTGQLPFRGTDTLSTLMAVSTENPTPVRALNPSIPVALETLVMQLLAKEVTERPVSALSVAKEIEAIGRQLPREALGVAGSPDTATASLPTMSPRSSTSTQQCTASGKALPLPASAGQKVRFALVAAVLLAVLGIGGWYLAPAIFRVQTDQGEFVIETNDPDVAFSINQMGGVTIQDKKTNTTYHLKVGKHKLPDGDYEIVVTQAGTGLEFDTTRFTIKRGEQVAVTATAKGLERTQSAKFTNSLGMEFVLVPSGKFSMGGGGGKPGTKEVGIPNDFYLGKFEVTQQEWEAVTGSNPSYFSRTGAGKDAVKDIPEADLKRFPVENVSWDTVQLFLQRLNARENKAGWVYRLPTQAEWEYACRGGPSTVKTDYDFHYYFDKPANQLEPNQANFNNLLPRPCKVGSYKPNRLGLYDMHGNVWEWCDDVIPADPKTADFPASRRVRRGGAWHGSAVNCMAARGHTRAPSAQHNDLGLRLARVPVSAGPERQFRNSLGMEFVLVPKGKFWMGGGGGKPGTKEVEIPHDFYLGKYELTQGEWEAVTGSNPSQFSRGGKGKDAVANIAAEELKRFPVEDVSWNGVQLFLEALNAREKSAGWVYRLPTEAEWEYACRGGPSSVRLGFHFYFEKPSNELLLDQANFNNVLKRTCKVGSYKPNPLGLYDMHGNVHEWCDDELKASDGHSRRVNRGGGWNNEARDCLAGGRGTNAPSSSHNALGLRLARVPVTAAQPANTPPLAVAPFDQKQAKEHQKRWADHLGVPVETTNSIGMKLVLLPAGKFLMGSPKDEEGRGDDEQQQEVTISKPFYMGAYEVTQEEYEKLMGGNPSSFGPNGKYKDQVGGIDTKRFPVQDVGPVWHNWKNAWAFCAKLSDLPGEKQAGRRYRLPTEAEWEFACRAGTQTPFHCGASLGSEKANFAGTAPYGDAPKGPYLHRPTQVGSYPPNAFGLHDMHGNVWELCWEWIPGKGKDPQPDPTSADRPPSGVIRGGYWKRGAVDCRSAARNKPRGSDSAGNGGFRVVCFIPEAPAQPTTQVVPPSKGVDEAWIKSVREMPFAKDQVDAVAAKLKELNPGFDGKVDYEVKDNRVSHLSVKTFEVTDLSPIAGLTKLQGLNATGLMSRHGVLVNIEPLRGLPLAELNLDWNRVEDLRPLTGMPLQKLIVAHNQVRDLAAIKGLPLIDLNCHENPIADLSPLEGMPLQRLQCGRSKITDLTPLKKTKLTWLYCNFCGITDLSPLKGLALTYIRFENTPVTDYSPLKDMPLEEFFGNQHLAANAPLLRSIKTLKRINFRPVAEFWMEFDAKSPPKQ